MRFNHMEITFPVGTLTDEFRNELDAFLRSGLWLERHGYGGRGAAMLLSAPGS